MIIDVATLFPDMCDTVLSTSIIGRARAAGFITVDCHDIRGFSENRHRRVDDSPYGGGMGMVMQAEPIYNCVRYISRLRECRPHVVYLSPKGKTFSQESAERLSKMNNIILLCGHYEGVDQRALDTLADEELSIGDYVLTGGELAAMVVIDAVARLCEGVLPAEECYTEESFQNGMLEYPHYTRPPVWQGMEVPEVLTSGNHKNIAQWRREQSIRITLERRPALIECAQLSKTDIQYINAQKKAAEKIELLDKNGLDEEYC